MKDVYDEALRLHKKYRGKIEVIPKVPISEDLLAIWYTPGVAGPSKEIASNPLSVFDYTFRWNTVAVVSDGTRVLGLGDIGAKGALPVMEGKALLFKILGGVDAFPIVINSKNPDEIVLTVKNIAPTFGGINLEDISSPKCFYIYKKLSNELDIPVFHDDRFGTAVVVLAGLKNALKVVGKKLKNISIAIIGAGAAGLSVAELLINAGADSRKMYIVDSKGILYNGRPRMNEFKAKLARITNKERRSGKIMDAIKDSDVTIGLSRPGPGIITGEMIKKMADNPIVFALANPVPEIMPEEAKKAGARIVATGRSDYPNQVNNLLGFPAIFRGMLDVRATKINVGMMIAAADEIAKFAEEKGINENYIIPKPSEIELYPREAAAVAEAAVKTNVARLKISYSEELKNAKDIINNVQMMIKHDKTL